MSSTLALLGGEKTVSVTWPEWPILGDPESRALEQVLRTRQLSILRKEGAVQEFEEAFAAWSGAPHALSFSSGTAALHAACFACGVGPGAEVLTPSYTWVSAIAAILHGNGVPVFCDVAPGAFHIDPAEIRRKCTPRTKAVIVCHAWGVPAPMTAILQAAREVGIRVIEDASHCHGATYGGRFVGTLGDVGCFSLQGTKSLVAGEGGVLVTNERTLVERAMIPGHHPLRLQESLTLPELAGFGATGGSWKYRASPLAMAIAAAQLPRLDEWNAIKLENYTRLEARLRQVPFLRFPCLPAESTRGFYGSPCWYGYDEQRVSRDTFLGALAAEGAVVFTGYENWYQTLVFQDMSLFRQLWIDRHANGARYRALPPGALPHTDEAVRRTLVLPAWGQPAPELVDQYAAAFDKVAANMDALTRYQAEKRLKVDER